LLSSADVLRRFRVFVRVWNGLFVGETIRLGFIDRNRRWLADARDGIGAGNRHDRWNTHDFPPCVPDELADLPFVPKAMRAKGGRGGDDEIYAVVEDDAISPFKF
jgi:hypothetical protein